MVEIGYTIIDVLDKLIYTMEKKRGICLNSISSFEKISPMYILSNVLINGLNKSIQYYKKLREETDYIDKEVIDFVVYDKISFLINQFNEKKLPHDIENVKVMVKFCLEFKKNVLALYINIRGRLIKTEEDTKTKAYEIMCSMISDKEKDIRELESFIFKYNL